mmetsp:Transcript_24411/g.35874  ORF Transcript_24411/g.35874 Transcript_24411/m.35874 type:complete len:200 (-) Transcript_24411:152-751(-)
MFRFQLYLSRGSRLFSSERALKAVKPGALLKINNTPHRVVKITRGKRGKGGGFVKATLRNITSQNSFEKTFTSDEMVEEVESEKHNAQYSWTDGNDLIFLNSTTFDEIRISKDIVSNHQYLAEGEEYRVMKIEGKYVGVEFPTNATYTVVSLDIGGSNSAKMQKAVVNSGASVDVPEFVNVGDRIRINVEEGTYLSRDN